MTSKLPANRYQEVQGCQIIFSITCNLKYIPNGCKICIQIGLKIHQKISKNTKKFVPENTKNTQNTKNTKYTNYTKIYQKIPFQGLQKRTEIGIFGMQIPMYVYHLAILQSPIFEQKFPLRQSIAL
jgi:hypothetical protein